MGQGRKAYGRVPFGSAILLSRFRRIIRLLGPPQGRTAPPVLSQTATKSAPPFAGSAGRLAILAPVLGRTSRVDVIKTEANMFTVDHINELRAELAGCFFSKRMRRALEAELAALISERDAQEKVEAKAVQSLRTLAPAPS